MNRHTQEQIEFVRKHAEGKTNQELVDLFNDNFNLKITREKMKALKGNHKIKSGLTGRFEKGHTSWNKGMKGLQIAGSEKGWFQKGQAPTNWKPVGSERLTKDGYVEVKIEEPNIWEVKHRIVWEKEVGPIPAGHALFFLDGDRKNCQVDNLRLIKRSQLLLINRKATTSIDKTLNETRLTEAELIDELSKVSKNRGLSVIELYELMKYKGCAKKLDSLNQKILVNLKSYRDVNDKVDLKKYAIILSVVLSTYVSRATLMRRYLKLVNEKFSNKEEVKRFIQDCEVNATARHIRAYINVARRTKDLVTIKQFIKHDTLLERLR